MRSVIDACVRFRLLVVALAAGIMVIGILRLATMPADALPATSPPLVSQPVSPTDDTMVIGLTPDGLSRTRLSALTKAVIVPQLRGLPGVSEVGAFSQPTSGIVLVVRQAPSASVFTVSREVDQAVAVMAAAQPRITFDTGVFRADTYVRSALYNLRVALVAAAVLAALALLALLLQLRLAFTALFAMTLSLVSATALLYLLGYTFNAVVMLGLLLALALVVTEAASEAQAIASRIGGDQQAPSVRAPQLVAAACGDLRGSLTAAGIAAAGCVVPLLLATGLTASFLRPMTVAFILAVVASMIVAVTVTPALAAVLLAVVPPATHGTPLARLLAAGYTRSIGALARSPRLAIACAAVCVAAGVAGLALLPALHPAQPTFADRALIVRLSGPPRVSLATMDRMTARASGDLIALPSVQDVGAAVGGRTSELWVTLNPDVDYKQALNAVRAVAHSLPGMAGAVGTSENASMEGVLSGPDREPVATRVALIFYVIAALAGVLALARAATGNWRMALLAFGSLPVSLAGGVFMAFGLGAAGELGAMAGLLAVFALAVRQAIAATSRAARTTADADSADLGLILTPAVLTAVMLAPFAALGDVPGMELPHTAALVILGGLVTTTLVNLFVLPALVPRARQGPGPGSRQLLASSKL